MLITKWSHVKYAVAFFGLLLLCFVIRTPHAHASACPMGASWQFPDQNCGSMAGTFTARATWTTTELCHSTAPSSCMQGAVNQVIMYIPDTLVNTTQQIRIVDGCDDTPADNVNGRNSRGATATTTFYATDGGGNVFSPYYGSDDNGCPDSGNFTNADIYMDVNISPSLPHYAGYYFVFIVAVGNSIAGDGASWYSNLYRMEAANPATGIKLGMAGTYTGSMSCSGWPYSCPSTGVAYTSITASDNSGVEWNFEASMAMDCSAAPNISKDLIIYDPDDGIYQYNMTLFLDLFDRATLAFQGPLTPFGGAHVSGGNDVTWPYTVAYNSDQIVRALTVNIGEKNSLQMLIVGDANAPNFTCGAPPPPPTDDFTLTAIAQVPAVTAGDAEQPQAADFGGSVGFSSTASQVNGVNTSVETFYNRGGTYDDVAGTLSGGTDTQIGTPNPIASTVNIVSKPTQALGTVNRAGIPGSLQLGDLLCTRVSVTPATGKVDATGAIQPGATGTSTSVRCMPIVNHPYARFYGNDIFAGADFANAAGVCPVGSAATIDVFSHANGVGGATQLGAMSDNAILGLATMSLRDAIGGASDARAFANTGGTAGFFGFSNCADQYATPSGLGQVNGITNGSGAYMINPANAGSLGAPFGISGQLALYYDGDVSITQNIVYTTSGWTAGTIPSLFLVITGNIYIQPGVTQLDGVYIAKDDGSGTKGRIFTCANGLAAPSNAQMQSGACYTNQLVVNGSFIAKHVNFMRTKGSLRGGSPGEQYNSGNIAEVFRFSPEAFMSRPALTPENTAAGYDSILSLSPTL